MAKINKLSFKRQKKEKGLAAVGNPTPNTDIKIDGQKCGYIDAPNWRTKDDLYRIRLALEKEPTPQEPASFKWVLLKATHESEEAARAWLAENWEKVLSDLKLHRFED